MTSETKYTLDDSASGKNAYYVNCKVQSQSVAYCACLNRQKIINTEAYPADWSPCKDAARHKECKALAMRHEEMIAGHAMFFKPRSVIQSIASVASAAVDYLRPMVTTTTAPAKKSDALSIIASGMGTSTYADAITAAAKDHKVAVSGAKPAAKLPPALPEKVALRPAKTVEKLVMQPGESLPDFLARLRAHSSVTAAV